MGWTNTRAKIAHTLRANPNANVTGLRQQLKGERLEQHVREVLAGPLPPTAEQCTRVAAVLTDNARLLADNAVPTATKRGFGVAA